MNYTKMRSICQPSISEINKCANCWQNTTNQSWSMTSSGAPAARTRRSSSVFTITSRHDRSKCSNIACWHDRGQQSAGCRTVGMPGAIAVERVRESDRLGNAVDEIVDWCWFDWASIQPDTTQCEFANCSFLLVRCVAVLAWCTF